MNVYEETGGMWFLIGIVVALTIIVGMYLFISLQSYRLAKGIGFEHAWISFVPAFQLVVYVLLYKETQQKFTTRELMLLFIGVPFLLNFVANLGSALVVLNVIYGIVSVVLLIWLVLHIVKEYTPRYSSSNYAVLSFFLGNLSISVWSLRHRDEIVKVYMDKTSKVVSEKMEDVIDFGDKEDSSIEEVEITDEIREEMFKEDNVNSLKGDGDLAEESVDENKTEIESVSENEDVKSKDKAD